MTIEIQSAMASAAVTRLAEFLIKCGVTSVTPEITKHFIDQMAALPGWPAPEARANTIPLPPMPPQAVAEARAAFLAMCGIKEPQPAA